MEYLSQLIDLTLQSFDFGFCIVVNILTYLIIKIIDSKKNKSLTKWQKRLVLLGAILILSIVYYFIGSDLKLIINSSILAPVFWSWIAKPICDKLGGHATSRNVNAKGHGRPAPMTTKAGFTGGSRRRYDNGGKASK